MEIEIINQAGPHHKVDRKAGTPPPEDHIKKRPIHISTEKKPEKLTDKKMQELIKHLENELPIKNTRFEFEINREINRIIVKVIDKKTDTIITELPPEEIQRMIAGIRKAIGLVIDKKI